MQEVTHNRKRATELLILGLIILIPLIVCGYFGYSYFKYSVMSQLTCRGFEWWEDKAECAADLALKENDPRYCRIDLLGEVGDLCATIYASQTTDPATCPAIDNIQAEEQCKERF